MSTARRRRCFVISPIGQENSETRDHADDVFDFIIKPALKECDIDARRSDHLHEPGKISEQMFSSIFNDDLCVAVLTGNNPNVFYELAIAQAAARPVIILAVKGQELPFDIKDLRCVHYDLKIRSYDRRTYIEEVIAHVRKIDEAGWVMPPPFGVQPPLGGATVREEYKLYETATQFGYVDEWLDELRKTEKAIDLMGVSLAYWRGNKEVDDVLVRKAQEGCLVRLLIMDRENPALPQMAADGDAETGIDYKLKDIDQMDRYFARLVKRADGNIVLRHMRRGMPHLSLTRTDHVAAIIQFLYSAKLRYSPMWLVQRGHRLYDQMTQEFEALWQANEEV